MSLDDRTASLVEAIYASIDDRVAWAIRRSISATTVATTCRAVLLVVSGITSLRLSSVLTR